MVTLVLLEPVFKVSQRAREPRIQISDQRTVSEQSIVNVARQHVLIVVRLDQSPLLEILEHRLNAGNAGHCGNVFRSNRRAIKNCTRREHLFLVFRPRLQLRSRERFVCKNRRRRRHCYE